MRGSGRCNKEDPRVWRGWKRGEMVCSGERKRLPTCGTTESFQPPPVMCFRIRVVRGHLCTSKAVSHLLHITQSIHIAGISPNQPLHVCGRSSCWQGGASGSWNNRTQGETRRGGGLTRGGQSRWRRRPREAQASAWVLALAQTSLPSNSFRRGSTCLASPSKCEWTLINQRCKAGASAKESGNEGRARGHVSPICIGVMWMVRGLSINWANGGTSPWYVFRNSPAQSTRTSQSDLSKARSP